MNTSAVFSFMMFCCLILLGNMSYASTTDANVENGEELGLLDAYNRALEADSIYASAQADHRASTENVKQGLSRMLPKISVSADYRHINEKSKLVSTETNIQKDDFYGNSYSLLLTQPLYRKSDYILYSQSKLQTLQGDLTFNKAIQELTLRFTQAYLDMAKQQAQLELSQALQNAFTNELERTQLSAALGTGRTTDRYDAQASFDYAVANVIQSQYEVMAAKSRLSQIVGNTFKQVKQLKKDVGLDIVDTRTESYWSDLALQENFEIQIIQQEYKLTEKDIDRIRAERLPTLDLVARALGDKERRKIKSELTNYEVSLQLEMPIYTGGMNSSQIRQAIAQSESKKYLYTEKKREVAKSIQQIYGGLIKSQLRINALKRARESTEKALKATQDGLELGVRTMRDVLETQRRIYDIRLDLLLEKYGYVENQLQILYVAGQLDSKYLGRLNTLVQ